MTFRLQTIFGVLFLLLGVRSLETDKYEETGTHDVEEGLDEDATALEEGDLRKMFRWFDADKDGRASLDEIMQFSKDMRQKVAAADAHAVIEEMDTDHSKTLSFEEVEADVAQWGHSPDEDASAKSQRLEVERAKFNEADSDKNGVLDKPEMPGYFYPETNPSVLEVMTKAAMKEKDLNGDGKLSLKEFWGVDLAQGDENTKDETTEGQNTQDSGNSGATEGTTEVGTPETTTDDEEADFKMLDLNKDKYLGLDELRAWESGEFHTREAMRKMIEVADQDHDMHLSADELVKAREKIAGMDAQYSLTEWIEQDDMLAEL